MGDAGTFPFGWVRDVGGDNWQIIWDPRSKNVVAKGARTGEVRLLGESESWKEAKMLADSYIREPGRLSP